LKRRSAAMILRFLAKAAGGLSMLGVLSVAVAAADRSQDRSMSTRSWQAQAEADIRAAHRLIEQAHPGMLERDPAFHAWRTLGFREAMALARQADTEARAWTALRFYAAGYRDGHLAVWRERAPTGGVRWAGWNVQSRLGKYVVTRSAEEWLAALPRIGDELLSCDGVPVGDWLDERVAPYVDRRGLDAARSRVALHLTNQWADEQPWRAEAPSRCRFRTAAGRTRDIRELEGLVRRTHPLARRDAAPGRDRAVGGYPLDPRVRLHGRRRRAAVELPGRGGRHR